ncbi:MAG: tetratricopeptide repeat protein [Patescibacteria group bacterium]|nr:tetratricopeptide repeat protein [Patescibacteria group bacterium]
MHKELVRALNLLNKGKIEEALQLITNFEKLGDLNPEDKHNCRFIKGLILYNLGRFQEGFRLAEQDYQESKSQNKPLFLIDSIVLKWNLLLLTGRQNEAWEDVVLCEKLLKSATKENPIDLKLREGFFHYMKGYFSHWERNYDKAIEHHTKSLSIFENIEFSLIIVPNNLTILGASYKGKGELDKALVVHKKSLDLSKGNTMTANMIIGVTYHDIGAIFFQKGALNQAIEYFEKSLKIWEQYTFAVANIRVGYTYDSLIQVFLYKDSPKEAQKCLDRLSQYLEQNKISKNFPWYRLSKARTLRSSSRVRDRAEAEKTLKDLIGEHKVAKGQLIHGLPEEFTVGLIELCDFYLEELRLTNDLKIIDDIQPYIKRLLEESERTKSYTLQAQTYLLQGKISLLLMNMGDARRYLTQAQHIAEEHSLQLLAREISSEHDNLLEQLDKWEEFKESNASISERMALASLDESIELIQKKRAIKVPELIDEEPVLLLILAEGGFLLFSYPFSDEVKVEDELFGGFLSAITTFSDEALSEGLDRAKFGQYTVLMKNITDFSFCYLFKGESYLAQKNLSDFTKNFQKNTSMMQTLSKFNKTSQVIELKDFPFLEGFIKGIFTSN